MKEGILPDYRKKQQLLYTEKRTERELIAYGDNFRAAGRMADALEFYQMARHTVGLEDIRNAALGMGDVMLFQQASRALNRLPAPEEWRAVGAEAKEKKKYFFALQAFEKAGDDKLLEETRTIIQREMEGRKISA